MIYKTTDNGLCGPLQVITFNTTFGSPEEINKLYILKQALDNAPVTLEDLQKYNEHHQIIYKYSDLNLAYSIDGVCWSCYSDYQSATVALFGVKSDFFLRIKVRGPVSALYRLNENNGSLDLYSDWSVSLASGFDFSYVCDSSNANLYNPYANMDCAIQLQTQLAETVSCMFGVQAYYFKVNGVNTSADVTFKEYALKSVESVKKIKLVISDGAMPSSKPEFSDLGLDFQTDWEVEVTKGTFATAFGNTAQPQEGDFVYIPMMKRMWSVTGAWEEKNNSLMWVGMSFKLSLVKYQDDAGVSKDTVDNIVNDLVKTKYEDLFGDEETLGSGTETASLVTGAPAALQPVFESDACRRHVSEIALNSIKNANTNNQSGINNTLYYKGTQICDSYYDFTGSEDNSVAVIYQRQYCGDEFSISFLLNISDGINNTVEIISSGGISVTVSKEDDKYYINNKKLRVAIIPRTWYFVAVRGSKTLNTADITAATYKYPDGMPAYKIQKFHYYFDIDNAEVATGRFSDELSVTAKSDVKVNCFNGLISNFKLLNIYNDNISELLMQNPTNQHLLINDTALPFLGLYGPNQY